MNIVFNCYTCSVSLCYIFWKYQGKHLNSKNKCIWLRLCHFNVILRDSVCAVHVTHALTKDVTQSKDCKSVQETLSTDRNEQWWESSWRQSGVMETVMFSVWTKIPKNTIEVAGKDSFSGEESKPRTARRVPKAQNASYDCSWISALPKSSMKFVQWLPKLLYMKEM